VTASSDDVRRGEPGELGEIDLAGRSHTGILPRENQDHYLVATLRKSVEVTSSNLDARHVGVRLSSDEAYLMIVADGVGGRAGGAEASSSAVESTLEYLAQVTGCFHSFDVDEEQAFLEKMERAVLAAHETILSEYGASEWTPATTLTMMMLVVPRAYLVHVGDTRAYYMRRGRLLQLTRDQTFGQYLLDSGALTEEQAAASPMARTLASAVGSSEVRPTLQLVDLEPGDTVLLCSDGLTKHVPNKAIVRILGAATSASGACDALVDAALAGGGSDNITAVVARCGVK